MSEIVKPKIALKQALLDYLFFIPVAGAIIAFDQWTKTIIRTTIPLGSDWLPEHFSWLMPYARFRHWHNTGAAFGLFKDGNLVFTILAILVSLVILYYVPRTERKDWWLRLALAMQFAGAVGNLIDRLMFQKVTDFISVGDFAIFNVADASISVGVAILALGAILNERKLMKQAKTQEEEKSE